jgi:hypothetical protein
MIDDGAIPTYITLDFRHLWEIERNRTISSLETNRFGILNRRSRSHESKLGGNSLSLSAWSKSVMDEEFQSQQNIVFELVHHFRQLKEVIFYHL